MGSGASIKRSHVSPSSMPDWINAVSVKESYLSDKFDTYSDGFTLIAPRTVVRHRKGKSHTDAARWSRGFTSGKHVFEFVFPVAHRGAKSSVGVGLKSAQLQCKGNVAIIGNNVSSWGICLKSKKAFHNAKTLRRYPKTRRGLPDKFFMYLDVDGGTLSFASDEVYYGIAVTDVCGGGEALYPMVGSCMQGASVSMVYHGEGRVVEGYLRKKRR